MEHKIHAETVRTKNEARKGFYQKREKRSTNLLAIYGIILTLTLI